MPRSLFGRALIIIVAPLVMVQLIAGFVFYDRVWETVTRRLAHGLAGDVGMIVQFLSRYPDGEARDWVAFASLTTTGLDIRFEPGAILANAGADPGSGLLERRLVQALNERVRRPFVLDVWSHPREVWIDVQLPDGVLHVRAQRERVFTSTVYIFLMWMVGSSLIFLAIASVFMRNQVRPIRRLAEAAEEFGKGRDVSDFRPAGAAEVRQAAAAFIVMRERIRRFLQQRTEMLAGISHDLRTPLTRMKLELAMFGDSHPSVPGLKSDVADMERMVDSYLAFVRGEGEEQPEPVDLGRLIGDIAASRRREGDAVSVETEGDLVVPLRPQAAKRCFDNLIANAVRHGTKVDIRAARRDSSVEIMIDDNGPGIPPHAREDVFKPFYRLDASRNISTGGVGLGLTIARDFVRGHGGEITLDDSPLNGLRVRIRLPV
jgi:two-component system, OmpR family, osmolarity sensor histidine kinase EnvZ